MCLGTPYVSETVLGKSSAIPVCLSESCLSHDVTRALCYYLTEVFPWQNFNALPCKHLSTLSFFLYIEGLPGVFGEQGNRGNLATGTREQSKKIVGNKGTSNRLGNRGTNTKNYKALRFLHKRGDDRRFSAVF